MCAFPKSLQLLKMHLVHNFMKLSAHVHHRFIFPVSGKKWFEMKLTLYDKSRKEGVLVFWLNAGIRSLKALGPPSLKFFQSL